jgi:hypothetical protein
MASFRCYSCGATVVQGQKSCTACGAEQTKSALAAFQQVQEVKAKLEQTRSLLSTAAMLLFLCGAGLGFWMGRNNPDARPSHISSASRTYTIEEVNDLFKRQMNEYTAEREAPIQLMGWVPGSGREVIFEMMPPTESNPAVLWETLNDQERTALVGFLSLAYTQALIAGGQPVSLEQHGHPVFTLRYYGTRQPVAMRTQDGTIRIGPSPFARGGAPTPVPGTAP